MLLRLAITNLATIKSLTIEFGDNFSVFTGETGAGKSILVDAIRFVLGAKASPDQIRTGADHISVEAVFDISRLTDIQQILMDLEIPWERELVLRRNFQPTGRGRSLANDCIITQQKLENLGNHLVNIHGQHDNKMLLNKENHLDFLDAFLELVTLKAEVAKSYAEYARLLREKKNQQEKADQKEQRREELVRNIEEIQSAGLKINEEEELGREHSRLSNVETLENLTGTICEDLYEADGAILSRLSILANHLKQAAKLDRQLEPDKNQLEPILLQLEDIYRTLNTYKSGLESDPNRLELINTRLAQIERISRRYGGNVNQALEQLSGFQQELETLTHDEERLEELQKQINQVAGRLHKQSNQLSEKRKQGAEQFDRLVKEQLMELGMEKALFKTKIQPLLSQDGKTPLHTSKGKDKVEFLLTTNPGQDLRPFSKIASGGELSRTMLALKTVLAKTDPTRSLIFDEVDSGISGAQAETIGSKLLALGKTHQVLCITHLPQIAALGTHHFLVSKETEKQETFTHVNNLSEKEKVREIARLLSGLDISNHSLASAEEMVNRSREATGVNE